MLPLYYLHQNGQLIYKPAADITDMRDSDFVVTFWPRLTSSRMEGWKILVEALALGADITRVQELAEKWGCDNKAAANYAQCIGVKLEMDGTQFFATRPDFVNLHESPAGFGDTALAALADLASKLGYSASKMSGPSFVDLLTAPIEQRHGACA